MSTATDQTAEPQDAPEDQLDEEQPEPTGKRAARQRAEAAEARATAAEQRVQRLLGAEAARIAGAVLAVGADALDPALGGVALDDLLDEEGDVNADAVREAAEAVAAARPGLRAQRRNTMLGSPDGGARQAPPRTPSWSDVDVTGGQR